MISRKLIIGMMLLFGLGTILFAGCSNGKATSTDTTTTVINTGMDNMGNSMGNNKKIADEFKDSKNPFRLEDNTGYDPAAMTKGKELFLANCTACHGEKGNGKGPSAQGLNPPPRDFTADHLKTKDERQMMTTISNGSEATAMVPFKAQFSMDERWQLISYLCTLNPSGMCAAPGSANGGSNMDGNMPDNMKGMNH